MIIQLGVYVYINYVLFFLFSLLLVNISTDLKLMICAV